MDCTRSVVSVSLCEYDMHPMHACRIRMYSPHQDQTNA